MKRFPFIVSSNMARDTTSGEIINGFLLALCVLPKNNFHCADIISTHIERKCTTVSHFCVFLFLQLRVEVLKWCIN